ncbi:30S ribosomal protein S14 [Streptomyces sp. SD15]
MSAHCMLTGAQPGFGNSLSHSHRRTSRRFDPNVQRERYRLPSEGRCVRLRLSAKGIETVDSIGVERSAAQAELCRQPRDAGATRVRNRDSVDGRPRGSFRAFGLSRVNLRGQAHGGSLPGVRKSSW